MKTHTLEYEGKKISYKVRGTGTPIFLLHGYCVDSSIWDEFIKELPTFKIIRPDFSGFGQSDLLDNYSIETLARTVKAIADELKIKKCLFVGHSMGGYVALALAEFQQGADGRGKGQAVRRPASRRHRLPGNGV